VDTELTFGDLLRHHRYSANLTQEALAARAGLTPQAISLLERGERRRPHKYTVDKLAEVLGLTGHDLARFEAAARRSSVRHATAVPSHGDLPTPVTPLVGREHEATSVVHLLLREEVRLLTLTGPGGVGKTRLAVEVAGRLRNAFADGVAFVPLAPLRDVALLPSILANALGIKEVAGQALRETLEQHLRDRQMLLVLDNFEHLPTAVPVVAALVGACPQLAALVTSRGPLRLDGEHQFPVPPLRLPEASLQSPAVDLQHSPAIELFRQRAQAVMPTFELTHTNVNTVAEICRRLDGLPLALELAAANVRLLEPTALLARLDQALSTAWTRDLPERQRTMRSTLDWSHDLLTENERVLFRRLSVFSGGFTLEAAEETCAFGVIEQEEVLELLGRLLEQSLVTVSPAADGSRRYGMLEPVRQYARENLEESGEVAATRERHAQHFVTLAETAKPVFLGPEYPVWSGRLERDHDNLREVLRWAREAGDVCAGLRLVGALSWFWWTHGYLLEGRRWAEELLSQPFDDDHPSCAPARAGALCAAGELAFGQGDLARAAALFEESLALYRGLKGDSGVAAVLVELGQVARAQGEHDRAAALSEESLDLGHTLGDTRVAAIALSTLGRVERHRGNTEGAIAHYEESLALFREIGHGWGSAYTLANLAVAAHGRGDLQRALALNKESLSIYSGLGDKSGMALVLINLGDVAREQGDENQAVALYTDALAMYREVGNERGMDRALGRLAPR
jgi:predicted ATPase/transcriptional regulator with XRE-family HTH domain